MFTQNCQKKFLMTAPRSCEYARFPSPPNPAISVFLGKNCYLCVCVRAGVCVCVCVCVFKITYKKALRQIYDITDYYSSLTIIT